MGSFLFPSHSKEIAAQKSAITAIVGAVRVMPRELPACRFVPSDLLKILGREDIITVRLGDQVQREMTILFLDIRAFTRLSETLSPKENFDFLNRYFKSINPIVKEHFGFIDKYIGDAVMALFPERPEDALNAAIALVSELQKFNQTLMEQGGKPISIGIGAHTGKLMLRTIGNEDRMEGTVISEAVNLASRIEGISKFFGVSVVTSQETLGFLLRMVLCGAVKTKNTLEGAKKFYFFCFACAVSAFPFRGIGGSFADSSFSPDTRIYLVIFEHKLPFRG